MKVTMTEPNKGKYQLIGEFEVGNSGVYEQRILVSNLSHKKALVLQKQFDTGKY